MSMGHRNLNKSFALIAALLMALCAFAVLTADDINAEAMKGGEAKATDFKQDHAGTLTIYISNISSSDVVRIVVTDGSTPKVDQTFNNLEVSGSAPVSVSVQFKLSKGIHDEVRYYVYTNGNTTYDFSDQISIESKDNIWTHVSSYVVIVILVIIVVIIAVVYMRARPNNKPTTTFTQLEQERKAAASAKEPAAPVKTEKVKYSSSRRK